MPFIERFEPSENNKQTDESLIMTANKFKMMAETPTNEAILKDWFKEWVDLLDETSPDIDKRLWLQFQINVFGSVVAQAREAERELETEMKALTDQLE